MLDKQKLTKLINEILELGHEPSTRELRAILRKYPKEEGGFYSKSEIIKMFESYIGKVGNSHGHSLQKVRKILRMKPTRTISGVAPITIFTKPYPCPGKCIFCPTQENMPKSYLKEEPGAQRALSLKFDPYEQTKLRIQALKNIGHNTDKIELIISGGTWSFYPRDYQEWFIKQTFKALNEIEKNKELDLEELHELSEGAKSKNILPDKGGTYLNQLHKKNENAKHRCVGLTIETRPDFINEEEIINLRKLGVTKVQLGIQSLDDEVLKLNKRGHSSKETRNAINLLRLAGFKIHVHWMANLYGSNIENDHLDFERIFLPSFRLVRNRVEDIQHKFVRFRTLSPVWGTSRNDKFEKKSQSDFPISPDELKIYPCSVLEGTPLFDLLNKGKHRIYDENDLIKLLAKCKTHVPEYCRITRLVRDIPSQLIKGGSKTTNLRQLVQKEMQNQNLQCKCIRCREIRGQQFDLENLKLKVLEYETTVSTEYFLSFLLYPSDTRPPKRRGGDIRGFNKKNTTPSNSPLSGEEQNGKLIGFLRLSLPKKNLSEKHFIDELKNSAIIREVHIYGRSLEIDGEGEAQHLGLGKKLLTKAEEIARKNKYRKISVISAVGTKEYYRKNGFKDGELYQCKMM